jgi:hypothetical protein
MAMTAIGHVAAQFATPPAVGHDEASDVDGRLHAVSAKYFASALYIACRA